MNYSQSEIERMTFGQWSDKFKTYRELYNFKTKQMLYKDIEDELEIQRMKSEPEVSLLDV